MLATGYYMLFVYVMFGCVYFFFSVCVRVCEICTTRIHHFFLIFFLCIFFGIYFVVVIFFDVVVYRWNNLR